MMKINNRVSVFILIGIACVAFGLRLYRLNAPLADWHSWRQSDTAAVARSFVASGVHPLYPRYNDLSNIQSGKDNPQGWRMVEFPLYQSIAALLARQFPSIPVETWLRLVSVSVSAGSVILLGLLLFEFMPPLPGLLAAVTYTVLPYSVFFGRTILPDTFMVFWALLSLVLLAKMPRKASVLWLVPAALSAAVALLSKPTAAFLLVPSLYLIVRKHTVTIRTFIFAGIYAFIALVPLLWWRSWILRFPEGIPASEWLLNNNNIRFKGAWFHWLFAKRIGELILGFWGLILLGLGLVSQDKGIKHFSFFWLLGGLSYLVIFASGNVQHDYYQILLIPILSTYVGIGMSSLLQRAEGRNRLMSIAVGGVSAAFMIAFSWYTIRTYYWINRPEIVEAGRAADALLPKDAKVIAPYGGDTTFLYQTNRSGWPIGFEIDKKIQMGATHYVTVNPTDADGETKALAEQYVVLVRNDKYAIIDLTHKK